MLIVADASPLRYLVEIGAALALPQLYGSVLTTPHVMRELQFAHFPEAVRRWAERPPGWLKIESPGEIAFLDRLDEGEASAICLAKNRVADLVLIDERLGTDLARSLGLSTMGTLGVLREAGARGYLDFEASLQLLMRTRFRHTPELIDAARQRYEALCRALQKKDADQSHP